MNAAIDALRRDGVAVADTSDGHALPVIDVTHPRFAVPDDAAGLAALDAALQRNERQLRFVPAFLMRSMLRSAAKSSLLARAMCAGEGTFLDGRSTYAMKLGADNLVPPFDSPMDRKFAASPHVTSMRLRMQQVARQLADGLGALLSPADRRPLVLANIGGGPAIDSLNALILLARAAPKRLDRPVAIHVFDLDGSAAAFGRNALAAVTAPGGRLHGFDIAFSHHAYDWNRPHDLARQLDGLRRDDAHFAVSSEGAPFEYGSDAAIVDNLQVLRAAGAQLVVGSVTRDDRARARLVGANQFKVVPRGLRGCASRGARRFRPRRAGPEHGVERPGAAGPV
jgi:hypothetical protein